MQLTSRLSRRVVAFGLATLVPLFLYLTWAGSPSTSADAVDVLWHEEPEQVKDGAGKDAVEGGNDVAIPPECQAMWMADGDRKAFVRTLASRKVQQYVEWGGGGSTLCASRLVASVTTIEHNEAWCTSLQEQLKANNVTNVNLICSPVVWHRFGETPEGDGTYEQFQDYVDMVDTLGIPHFDVVFIDGRARVACAKKALSYISRSSVVLVHDWQRMHYQPIREWYDLVDKPHNQLAWLQKKPT